eukprot:COSAG02_NODE_5589_length_4207_cov_3.451558_3_plen_117_part_00
MCVFACSVVMQTDGWIRATMQSKATTMDSVMLHTSSPTARALSLSHSVVLPATRLLVAMHPTLILCSFQSAILELVFQDEMRSANLTCMCGCRRSPAARTRSAADGRRVPATDWDS